MRDLSSRDSHAQYRPILVRAASEADMEAVRDIYAHYVVHSLATFEETPPTLDDMLRAAAPLWIWACHISWPRRNGGVGFCLCGRLSLAPGLSLRHRDQSYVADGLTAAA